MCIKGPDCFFSHPPFYYNFLIMVCVCETTCSTLTKRCLDLLRFLCFCTGDIKHVCWACRLMFLQQFCANCLCSDKESIDFLGPRVLTDCWLRNLFDYVQNLTELMCGIFWFFWCTCLWCRFSLLICLHMLLSIYLSYFSSIFSPLVIYVYCTICAALLHWRVNCIPPNWYVKLKTWKVLMKL